MSFQYRDRKSFTVPAGAGSYAPEEIIFAAPSTSVAQPSLLGVTALVEALAATSVVELWLLKVGGDPTNSADWFISGKSLSAVGSDTFPLASYPGAKIRVKSGGTAGTTTVSASAD